MPLAFDLYFLLLNSVELKATGLLVLRISLNCCFFIKKNKTIIYDTKLKFPPLFIGLITVEHFGLFIFIWVILKHLKLKLHVIGRNPDAVCPCWCLISSDMNSCL